LSGQDTMETIHESVDRTNGFPHASSEAAMFSVVRPSQLRTTEALMSAIDNLAGRSVSLKVPLQKKPSLGTWVKRSNTSRYLLFHRMYWGRCLCSDWSSGPHERLGSMPQVRASKPTSRTWEGVASRRRKLRALPPTPRS
jgi:hypothetical protein